MWLLYAIWLRDIDLYNYCSMQNGLMIIPRGGFAIHNVMSYSTPKFVEIMGLELSTNYTYS